MKSYFLHKAICDMLGVLFHCSIKSITRLSPQSVNIVCASSVNTLLLRTRCPWFSLSEVLKLLILLSCLPQSIRPLEFTVRNERISIAFVEATIYSPMVAKGSICRDMKVFPAECRGRRCSYKGKLVVSLRGCQRNWMGVAML